MSSGHLITVEPAPVGWRVCFDNLQPLMFLSGSTAEQHARGLAARLSGLGQTTQVMIRDHAQGPAGARLRVAK